MDNSNNWNNTYKTTSPKEIPWNHEEIPEWFKGVIESGWVNPCSSLDIGCGLGNYANYLARLGFAVLGVDFSSEAIELAVKKYQNKNLRFVRSNVLEMDRVLDEEFDFIYDVSLLHHIKPEDRKTYLGQLISASKTNAQFLLCCFNEDEDMFAGQKEFYSTETSTVIYPLSESEIRELFSEDFIIEKFSNISFGKTSNRKRHLVLMRLKG